jgi:hypothetical protein
MWIVLLIVHELLAFLLLGAITHQLVAVWAPVRAKAGNKAANFVGRFRAVPSASYANAVIVLYLITTLDQNSPRLRGQFDDAGHALGRKQSRRFDHQARTARRQALTRRRMAASQSWRGINHRQSAFFMTIP